MCGQCSHKSLQHKRIAFSCPSFFLDFLLRSSAQEHAFGHMLVRTHFANEPFAYIIFIVIFSKFILWGRRITIKEVHVIFGAALIVRDSFDVFLPRYLENKKAELTRFEEYKTLDSGRTCSQSRAWPSDCSIGIDNQSQRISVFVLPVSATRATLLESVWGQE